MSEGSTSDDEAFEIASSFMTLWSALRDDGDKPAGVDIAPLVASLEGLRQTNVEMLDALRSPTRTAGAELLERAWLAYSQGWFDDALRDAEASIAAYPYRAAAHLLKGLSAAALRRPAETAAALQSAVRYARGDELPMGATAALLMAGIADAVGAHQAGVRLLRDFRSRGGGAFPEIALALHIRQPDDDAEFAAAVQALEIAGLNLLRIDAPPEFFGLSPRLDSYLQVETERVRAGDAAGWRTAAVLAYANEVVSRPVGVDPWFLQHLSFADGVRPAAAAPAWTMTQLAALYGVAPTSEWIPAYADLARWLGARLDEFARIRAANAPPGSVLSDLSALAGHFSETSSLERMWADASAVSRAATNMVLVEIARSDVHVRSGSGQEMQPALAVPLGVSGNAAVPIVIAQAIANAPRRRAEGLPSLTISHNTPVVGSLRFAIVSARKQWELISNVWRDSATLTGGAAPVSRKLKAGEVADFPLYIDGTVHLLRLAKDGTNPWRCTVLIDGFHVDAYSP